MSRKRKSFRRFLGRFLQQLHPASADRRRVPSSLSGFVPRFEPLEQRQMLMASPVWVSPTSAVTAPADHVGLAPVSGDTVTSGDGSAAGKTFGTNAFATIQAGIDNVQAGGTVDVTAGTYTLTSALNIDQSLSLLGPNAGINPNGGSRVAEAVINGGASGTLSGNGPCINLGTGTPLSLTVQGLEFTNFDTWHVFYEGGGTPIASANLADNIFTGNNGGIFTKYNTSLASQFDVTDNQIVNQTMSGGPNTALFFLGDVAGSHFDANVLTNVASREMLNLYDQASSTTIDNNVLTNTAGLVGLFADATGVDIDGNAITNTSTASAIYNTTAPIVVGTYIGQVTSGLNISDNDISTVTGGSGVLVSCNDTAPTSSITGVTIQGNTISDTSAYGLDLDTVAGGSGTLSGIAVDGNTFVNTTYSPILAYARPGGHNSVGNLTISDNTIDAGAGYLTAGSFNLIDLRDVSGTNAVSNNTVTISGVLPSGTDTVRAIGVRGSQTGTIDITGNTLDGGGVTHNNSPTIFVSGVVVLSNDPTTGALPASAVIDVANNQINGFEDGIVVRDSVVGVYGNLPAGAQMSVSNNDLSGNSLYGLHSGSAGALIDASDNWWGGNSTSAVAAAAGANVDYTPWLDSGNNLAASGPGFQGDFSTLDVSAASPQAGSTGRIQEAIDLVAAGGTVNVAAGTYSEDVTVNKTLTLLGAQAGVDARTRTTGDESIVDSADGLQAIAIEADNVTIDGFTIEGVNVAPNVNGASLGAGVWMNPGYSGTHGGAQIVDNVIQNNIAGIELDNDGTYPALVQYNLIENNNLAGAGGGNGIESSFGLTGALIDSNDFVGQTNGSVLLDSGAASQVTISNNQMSGAGIALFGADTISIQANTISGADYAGIELGGGVSNATVSNNTVVGTYADPVYGGGAAIAVDNPWGLAPNSGQITISGNYLGRTGSGDSDASHDNVYGVLLGGPGTPSDQAIAGDAVVTIDSNFIRGNTAAGVENDSTGSAAIGDNMISGNATGILFTGGGSGSVAGNSFAGTANGTDLRLDASAGRVSAVTTNSFAGATFIDNESSQAINATTDTFNVGPGGAQVGGSALTISQGYAVEDRIIDAIDRTGLGFVRVSAGNLYVTPNSYVSGTSASGAVARAAAVAVSGDTINVQSALYLTPAPSTSTVYGTPATALSGTITAASWVPVPVGSVSVTVDHISSSAAITAGTGTFTDNFPGAPLQVAGSPYAITYSYSGGTAGGVNYNYTTNGTSNSISNAATTLTVTRAPLTVTAIGVAKTYDGTTTATVVLSDNRLSGDILTDSYTSASFSSASVGTNIPVSVSGISISGPDAGDYILQNTTASTTANIGPLTAVIDDGDPAWTTTGAWTNYTGQGYENDVDQATPITSSNGLATCAWTFGGLNPNQYYKVETTWTTNSNRATNAPYTISGGAVTLPATVNQQQRPEGVSALGWTWQELGVYEPTTGTLVVALSNSGANGNVIADAVRIEVVPTAGPAIMVQAGTGSTTEPVVLPTLSNTVQTTVNFGTTPVGGVSRKTFTLFNGGGGALNLSNLSVPAGYTIVSGFGATTVPPGGSTQFVLGQRTSAAGTFNGTVTFTTNDSADNPFSFPVTGTVGNVAPTATISNTGPVNVGNPVTVSLSNPYDPSSADTAAGFRYSFAFSEALLSKSYATTGTISSATYTFPTAGSYTVWGRILDVNGLYADYSTQITVKSTSLIIDDGDPAWTTTGTWTNFTGQGYENDVDQATPVTSTNGLATATWTFSGLSPGQYYKVETTWTKNVNRATNAPYTISGGTVALPVTINQQLLPVGVSGDNGTWQELGVYEPTTGTLVVTLSNSGANGNVIADAVRIEPVPVGGPAIMVQAGTGAATDPVVVPTLSGSVQTIVSFGTVAAGSVSQKTFKVFNGGGAALSLSNLSVPAGYTLASGFGTTTVPSGGSTTFVLQVNTSAVGALTGTVTFTTNDSVENPFSFPVTATVGDVAPTATISNSGPVAQGSSVTVSLGNPYDPVSGDTAAGFHYSFAFSEALLSKSWAAMGTTPSAIYTFATAGTYTVWGRILDKNNSYTDYSTQVTVNGLSTLVMNDGGPNFQTTGTWSYWLGQGYAGDIHQAEAPNSTATWTFSGLAAGNYLVYTTWSINANRADNAPYTVTVGSSTTKVPVNQRILPSTSIAGSGPTGGSWNWYQLGATSYTVGASGTLVVGLSNTGADGYVEADAVLLGRTSPELAAGGLGNNPHAAPLTANQAMPLVHEAEVRWAAAGANVSALGNIQVSVVNLPGTELAESSPAVDTIFLDTNAKGYGWFIDPTPGQDNEFSVKVAKTEELATSGPAAGQMDLLTVIMHEMGHFLGCEDLNPQTAPDDLMSADLAAGTRRVPQSVAAEQAQAKDAVFAALAQPQSGTTQGTAAASESDAWWLLYGQGQ